jgi:hypothetical protein
MSTETYTAGVLRQRWDDTARLYTEWDADGQQTAQRPYTTAENADADARANAEALALAQAELARAVQVNAAPEELAAVNAAALTAEGVTEGDPWRQPSGAQDAYPIDWKVSHNGKDWASLVEANVWEPPTNWRETGNPWPDWVAPTGSQDAYPKDAQVTHNDSHWVSLVDANVWEPGVYGWTMEGPA